MMKEQKQIDRVIEKERYFISSFEQGQVSKHVRLADRISCQNMYINTIEAWLTPDEL